MSDTLTRFSFETDIEDRGPSTQPTGYGAVVKLKPKLGLIVWRAVAKDISVIRELWPTARNVEVVHEGLPIC